MKSIPTVIALAAILVACGGKDKKKETVPERAYDAASEGADSTPAPSSDLASSEAAGTLAQLQQVVYFEFDSNDLDDAARSKLSANAAWLAEDASRTLTIEGHTDEVGTTEYNAALGERRAQAARDYLLRLGAETARIRIITYGEEKPASDQDELNRRSVFIATRR